MPDSSPSPLIDGRLERLDLIPHRPRRVIPKAAFQHPIARPPFRQKPAQVLAADGPRGKDAGHE
eukprot:5754497-Alexandrium_andersonii.AAC.1